MTTPLRAILVVCLALASPVLAQDASTSSSAMSLSVGAMQFDLSGTGTAPMVALRYERTFARFWLGELGVSYARPEQQFGATTTFIVPEFQLQFQLPVHNFAPYLGAGVGRSFDLRDAQFGGTVARISYSAAGGIRAWLTERLGARGELRLRGLGNSLGGSAAEWTVGAIWRL